MLSVRAGCGNAKEKSTKKKPGATKNYIILQNIQHRMHTCYYICMAWHVIT